MPHHQTVSPRHSNRITLTRHARQDNGGRSWCRVPVGRSGATVDSSDLLRLVPRPRVSDEAFPWVRHGRRERNCDVKAVRVRIAEPVMAAFDPNQLKSGPLQRFDDVLAGYRRDRGASSDVNYDGELLRSAVVFQGHGYGLTKISQRLFASIPATVAPHATDVGVGTPNTVLVLPYRVRNVHQSPHGREDTLRTVPAALRRQKPEGDPTGRHAGPLNGGASR